ncbi:LPXTG cell wall anchor domain protein [Lachnoanaerobaculum sp. ICM7]|uniref:LPXTG cell wall anchor domain-containing protein n=1 Tax=Lachnoanaerobaculum sp. ICM7 TaxID=936594 RepID=UPI00027A579B|nr:LPXTG cell wall anchor domain-containing protein [Lachnoanaerobaculum sp. ICM7]EJP23863.1 LPXTG cell wall anchor domain protein [Lachnoanaerobaculum sp. ICM7]
MKQIYKKIIFFLLLTYFIFVPRDALAANVKLPININVSGTNPVYYRYDVNISRLDSRNNVVSTEEISIPLRRNGTYTYDFGDFDDVGEYRYSISLVNADDERFACDRRNYIVHIQVLTNGTDIYTNTYLEDPNETAKPAAVDFNVKYLVEIVYPNERDKNKGGSDTGDNRKNNNKDNKKDNKKDGQKNTDKNNKKPSDDESRPDNRIDGEPLIIIDKPDNNKPDNNNKGKMIEVAKRLQKAIVKTGDESSLSFYTTLFFVSTCIFILLFFRRKKNHR